MTNYNQLKLEEKEIINVFKKYLKDVTSFLETQHKKFIAKKNSDEMFEESIEIDKKNALIARDILDDCIWFIQKNEPRANHLRLVIAIINSLSDVKRISNYVVTLCKFYSKCNKDIDDATLTVVKEMGNLSISTVKELYQLISELDLKKLKSQANAKFKEYIDTYKSNFYNSINNSINNKESVKVITNTIVVIKNFDRTVDHMMNIIDNLLSIN